MKPLHTDDKISINVIKDVSENSKTINNSKKLIYYPLFHYQIECSIKRLWFKSRIESQTVIVDPVRKLPALCDTIPLYDTLYVSKNSVIPFHETPDTFDRIVKKIARKYLFHKYPIVIPPTVSIIDKILIYKIFFQFQSGQNGNVTIIQDSITGEVFEIPDRE